MFEPLFTLFTNTLNDSSYYTFLMIKICLPVEFVKQKDFQD